MGKAYKCPECGWEFDTPAWCSGYNAERDDDSAAHTRVRAEENT
jgi:hypothetical protein